MRRDEWARLAAPFPPHALDWCVAQLDREGSTARLEPVVSEAAVVERLDAVLGTDGWSLRIVPVGPDAVVCELALLDVHKSAVARSFAGTLPMDRVAGWALGRAAGLCGMHPVTANGAWVDFDLEAGEPVVEPELGPELERAYEVGPGAIADGPVPSAPESWVEPVRADREEQGGGARPGADEGATVEAGEARSEGQQVIERLVDRLRAEGLGREAAALVVEHGGYGRTAEEARELYRRLRTLLLQKGAPS
jgi:hypothetical protein